MQDDGAGERAWHPCGSRRSKFPCHGRWPAKQGEVHVMHATAPRYSLWYARCGYFFPAVEMKFADKWDQTLHSRHASLLRDDFPPPRVAVLGGFRLPPCAPWEEVARGFAKEEAEVVCGSHVVMHTALTGP